MCRDQTLLVVRVTLAALMFATFSAAQDGDPTRRLDAARQALAAGDYPGAIEGASEAAGLFHARKDLRNEATAINTIGLARLYRGEYMDALQNFERALALDIAGQDANGEIGRLNNIGHIYFYQGKYVDALQSYERALRRVNETTTEPWNLRRRQLTLASFAILYEQLGQNEKALEYYRLAQGSASALPADEHAQLLSNLGTLYRRLGDPTKALEIYQAARRLFSQGRSSDGQIHVLHNIGIVLALDYKDLAGALGAFTEALHLAEATSNQRQIVLGRIFRGEALFRMRQLAGARAAFAQGLAAARDIGVTEEQWTAQYGLGRIDEREGKQERALNNFQDAINTIESVRSGLGNSSLKSDFLANKRDVYDDAVGLLLRGNGGASERLFALFEQARARNLQDVLRGGARPDLRSVQSRLHNGSLLIEYWLGKDRLAAFWVTRQAAGVISRAIVADDIDNIQRFVSSLPDSKHNSWKTAAARAGALLLSGIPMTGIRQVQIVPDGILYQLPFELLIPSGSSLFLERFAVSYLPSAALLPGKSAVSRQAPPWERQLIAFGNPIARSGGVFDTDERWAPLPDSARELRSVAAELPGRAEIHSGADNYKSYLVEGRAAGVPLLHLSTHAAVDTSDPNRSRILFTPEGGKKGSEYLFWREVQQLPLRGVELVTVSACDTEGGRLLRGEGVQSFSGAFLAAGAGATVTTLWRVADKPTAGFMTDFYSHLARGETKAEALRAAKLRFLRSRSELAQPRFWAAFVLNGNGLDPIGPFWSWWWIAAVILPALLLGVIVLFRFRRLQAARAAQEVEAR